MLIGALNLVPWAQRAESQTRFAEEPIHAQLKPYSIVSPPEDAVGRFFWRKNGLEPCEDNQLLGETRPLRNTGTNRQFVKRVGNHSWGAGVSRWSFLVDIHGPHEHQSLLHPNRQLAILDAFGKA